MGKKANLNKAVRQVLSDYRNEVITDVDTAERLTDILNQHGLNIRVYVSDGNIMIGAQYDNKLLKDVRDAVEIFPDDGGWFVGPYLPVPSCGITITMHGIALSESDVRYVLYKDSGVLMLYVRKDEAVKDLEMFGIVVDYMLEIMVPKLKDIEYDGYDHTYVKSHDDMPLGASPLRLLNDEISQQAGQDVEDETITVEGTVSQLRELFG